MQPDADTQIERYQSCGLKIRKYYKEQKILDRGLAQNQWSAEL